MSASVSADRRGLILALREGPDDRATRMALADLFMEGGDEGRALWVMGGHPTTPKWAVTNGFGVWAGKNARRRVSGDWGPGVERWGRPYSRHRPAPTVWMEDGLVTEASMTARQWERFGPMLAWEGPLGYAHVCDKRPGFMYPWPGTEYFWSARDGINLQKKWLSRLSGEDGPSGRKMYAGEKSARDDLSRVIIDWCYQR